MLDVYPNFRKGYIGFDDHGFGRVTVPILCLHPAAYSQTPVRTSLQGCKAMAKYLQPMYIE